MMTPARKEPDQSTYSGRFAARLRLLREKAKLTAEELADKIGVSYVTIYSWESSRTSPKIDQLPLISKTLKLKSPKELFPFE